MGELAPCVSVSTVVYVVLRTVRPVSTALHGYVKGSVITALVWPRRSAVCQSSILALRFVDT